MASRDSTPEPPWQLQRENASQQEVGSSESKADSTEIKEPYNNLLKKPRSSRIFVVCCFGATLLAALIAVGISAYAVYVTHTENAAIKRQLQQLNKTALTENHFNRLQEANIMKLSLQFSKLMKGLEMLEHQQNSSIQTIIQEQSTSLSEVRKDIENLQNETKWAFAELANEFNESREERVMWQQEMNTRVIKLSEQQNFTQEQTSELIMTVQTLSKWLNQTDKDLERLKSQVTNDVNQIHSDLNEVESALSDQFNRSQDSFTQVVASLEATINRTELEIRADIRTLTNETNKRIAVQEEKLNEVKKLLINKTVELQREYTSEIIETRDILNATKEQLSADLDSVNSTLTSLALTLKEGLSNVNSTTEKLLSGEIRQLSLQVMENLTEVEESLMLVINKTETRFRADINNLSDETSENITLIKQTGEMTQELLLNRTDSLQNILLNQITELGSDLNSTDQQLSESIDEINSTLIRSRQHFQDKLSNLSIEQSIQNALQLQAINTTQTDISMLSESVSNKERRLISEMDQLSTQTQNNFTELEIFLQSSFNASDQSLNALRTEVLQKFDNTRISLEMLRANTTTQLATLSTNIADVSTDLSTQIGNTRGEVTSLTNKARQNYTHLVMAVSSNEASVTSSLSTLQETVTQVYNITQGIEQISKTLEEAEGSIRKERSIRVQDVQRLEAVQRNLSTSQEQTAEELLDLEERVDDYHSDAAMFVGSELLIWLTAILIGAWTSN